MHMHSEGGWRQPLRICLALTTLSQLGVLRTSSCASVLLRPSLTCQLNEYCGQVRTERTQTGHAVRSRSGGSASCFCRAILLLIFPSSLGVGKGGLRFQRKSQLHAGL